MLSPEEIEELKSSGINIEATINMIKSQYELLKPLYKNQYNDSDKIYNMDLAKSILNVSTYAKTLLHSKLSSATAPE